MSINNSNSDKTIHTKLIKLLKGKHDFYYEKIIDQITFSITLKDRIPREKKSNFRIARERDVSVQ